MQQTEEIDVKTIAIAFLWVAMTLSTPAWAQDETQAPSVNEIELNRTVAEANRKLIVAKNLELTDEQATKFWPIYNESQAAMHKLWDRRIELIKTYANEYETLTDERALELVKEVIKLKKEQVDIRETYVKKLTKVLPGKKVARYFQIETKLDAIVDFGIAREIPLVE